MRTFALDEDSVLLSNHLFVWLEAG